MAKRSGVRLHLFSFRYSVNIWFAISTILLLSIVNQFSDGMCQLFVADTPYYRIFNIQSYRLFL